MTFQNLKKQTQTAPPLSPSFSDSDGEEKNLRPQSFDAFIGQTTLCNNLKTFTSAAKKRKESLDHVLLSGPPGLGKTTLAGLIAKEMGGQFRITSGASIGRIGELAAILTNLAPLDVLFIDEIHRLPKAVEEILYPPLEDGKLDLVVGDGPGARTMRLTLSPFTLVAATTRQGLLSRPLRDRFGIHAEVHFYTPEQLGQILMQASKKTDHTLAEKEALYLGKRSRGTPRIALRLLRRVIDFAHAEKTNTNTLSETLIRTALEKLGVDPIGLDALDRRYLTLLGQQHQGGPVGLGTLCAALFEEKRTLEDVVEPFLIQQGFIQRTPQGRVLSQAAYDHFGWPGP